MSYFDDPLGLPGDTAREAPPGGAASFDADPPSAPEVVEDVDAVLGDLERYVREARGSSMSTQVRLDRDHMLELIRVARARLPVALRSARWLIKERNDYLARARRDADELMEEVRTEAARMVHRTEVVKQAEVRARRIVEAAEEQARRMRLELEDYCDEHLARFEGAMERALDNVRAGRRKLQGSVPPEPPVTPIPVEEDEAPFFDQDQE